MSCHCIVRAHLHRPRYAPGDVVKATCTVRFTDRATCKEHVRGSKGLIPCSDELSRLEEVSAAESGDVRSARTVIVSQLTTQFVGSCVFDKSRVVVASHEGSRSSSDEVAFVKLLASPDAVAANDEPRCIFTSSAATPLARHQLHLHQQVSVCVSCTLPPSLPPTYRGTCARFYYGMHMACTWEAGGSTGVVALRVPIRVMSPIAAITILRAPYVATQRPLDVRAIVLPPLPTPAVAPPLSDQLLARDIPVDASEAAMMAAAGHAVGGRALESGATPGEACDGSSGGCRAGHASSAVSHRPSGAKFLEHTLRSVMAARCVITEFVIRHNGEPTLTLVLLSSAVSIGDSVRGVFVATPSEEYRCVRATVSIESFETVPRHLFRRGSVIPTGCRRDETGEELVVTQSRVVAESEFFLANASQLPFEFHLSPLRFTQTLRTDVVALSWCIRFRFWTARASDATRPGTTAVKLLPGPEELEIPLTLFAPIGTDTPREGLAAFAS